MTRQSVQRWERPLLYLLVLALAMLLGIMQWHLYRANRAVRGIGVTRNWHESQGIRSHAL